MSDYEIRSGQPTAEAYNTHRQEENVGIEASSAEYHKRGHKLLNHTIALGRNGIPVLTRGSQIRRERPPRMLNVAALSQSQRVDT